MGIQCNALSTGKVNSHYKYSGCSQKCYENRGSNGY